ncbi:MAG TPA: ABC transporter permease [Clostridiales bacterium]|nr:ABC transporter permease [Clostridiales bacterium]
MSLAKRFKLTDNTIRLIVFIVILAVFVIINPDVVSFANIISFCNNMVYNGLLAMALMMLFVMGILDLAVTGYGIFGAYATIVICMKFFMGINIWLMMLMSAVIGALCAMCTGYVIYKFKLPGILVSVAAGNIFTMALFLEGSGSGNVPATVLPPDWMSYNNINLYQASLGTMTVRLHFSVLILFAVIFAVWFYTKKTVEGRSIYAIGGNTEAAVRMGIDFRKTYLMTFAFAGFIAGLAIMMEYMRGGGNVNPLVVQGNHGDAIAAVIFGGTQLGTGKGGSVLGTLIGILTITLIKTSLIMLGVPSYAQTFVIGLLLLGSVVLAAYKDFNKE